MLDGTTVYYAYDGNGNVTDLAQADGTLVASVAQEGSVRERRETPKG